LNIFLSLTLTAFSTAAICYLVISTKRYHIAVTGDFAQGGPQKLHTDIVPRVGGVTAVVGAIAGGSWLEATTDYSLWPFAVVLLPCFMAGLLEDLTKKVSPAKRYVATGISAAGFCGFYGVTIESVAIPWLDVVFSYWAIRFAFTIFAIGSVAHAFNLIDGQNGLCSGVSVIAAVSVAAVAYEVGDNQIMLLAGLCASANIGFLVFNYPNGRIFLGDAGAYVNGALLGILTVWLTSKYDAVSPWFALAVLIYPVWETLFSMIRRIASGKPISAPDSEHLHSLMYKNARRTESLFSKSSAPKIWVGYAFTCWLAVLFYQQTFWLMGLCLSFVVIYLPTYILVNKTRQRQIQVDRKTVSL
jgi:UDP-N-acetylmuramyl pentapeptide phosphotransferase/UDP-N-acetylglucosamine-1-phosphate transferase